MLFHEIMCVRIVAALYIKLVSKRLKAPFSSSAGQSLPGCCLTRPRAATHTHTRAHVCVCVCVCVRIVVSGARRRRDPHRERPALAQAEEPVESH